MTTVKFQRGLTTKLYRQELWFLCSVRHLRMLYISMKFHDNILKVIERTRNYHSLIVKRDNSKNVIDKCYGSYGLMMLYISVKFLENILNGFKL